MNEYIVVYFAPPTTLGNVRLKTYSKLGAYECFKVQEPEKIILNIIEL